MDQNTRTQSQTIPNHIHKDGDQNIAFKTFTNELEGPKDNQDD